MKTEYKLSRIIEMIFKMYVSDKEKKGLLNGNGKALSSNGRYVRIQCQIPKEVYAILNAFGAFSHSESEFFTKQCEGFIEQRAIELKIMDSVLTAMAGGQ